MHREKGTAGLSEGREWVMGLRGEDGLALRGSALPRFGTEQKPRTSSTTAKTVFKTKEVTVLPP